MKGMRTLKQKKRNRLLAALLAVAMMFQMLPMMAFADEGTGSTAPQPLTAPAVEIGGQRYESLELALKHAPIGATTTIELGEGEYTLYHKINNDNAPADGPTTAGNKNLTFVGKGTDKTKWRIGSENPDPNNYDKEYNSDYSFKGNTGTVTFKDMTLLSKDVDYLGFSHTHDTVVENCVIDGRTAYWGYNSAEFRNTTFNAANGPYSYAIWTYSSPVMTFDHCTFNAFGKVINVYNENNEKDFTVNFQDCTVNSKGDFLTKLERSALNIDDSKRGNFKFIINISGNNTVDAALDKTTCSRVFCFGGKQENNTGHTDVYVNGKHVWGKKEGAQEGELKTHECSAGEADQAYDITYSKWETVDERNDVRNVTRTCEYCGWNETSRELASVYRLQYDLNGGTGAEGANYDDAFYHERESVALAAAPSCAGYDFVCWKDAAGRTYSAEEEIVLQGDTVLTAQWGKEPPEKPAESGESGCGVVSTVLIATGATAIGYYAGTQVLKHCYGLPYWPGNRSALALMLWEDADRPMPVSTVLYPDVGQKERDMDLQHAARWAMENELIPDLNLDDSKPEEEQKFFPNYAVSRAWALHAWNKAQKLKKNA